MTATDDEDRGTRPPTRPRLLSRRGGLLVALALGLAVAVGNLLDLQPRRTATPVPPLVYQIHAKALLPDGTTHKAELGNLDIGQPGVVAVPTPLDVDNDAVPDVLVSVNLVEIEPHELFDNDRDVGPILAPNVLIERNPAVILANKPSPPLSIAVQALVDDLEGGPETVIRFGYDAGCGALPWTDDPDTPAVEDPCTGDHGGSIPPSFEATVGGLTEFFNPLQAVVETKTGNAQGKDDPMVWYEGPLDVVFGLGQTDGGGQLPELLPGPHPTLVENLDARLAYEPWPDAVYVRYQDGELEGRGGGQHLDYAHGAQIVDEINLDYGTFIDNGEADAAPKPTYVRYTPGAFPDVDLTTTLATTGPDGTLDVVARAERMPDKFTVDLESAEGTGRFVYDAATDKRLPDIHASVAHRPDGAEPLLAHVDVTEVPAHIEGVWSFPDEGEPHLAFAASGQGMGAVEAEVANFEGDPGLLALDPPTARQYVTLAEREDRRFVTGRVEGVRSFELTGTEHGVVVDASIGDGVLPLEVQIDSDRLLAGQLLDATSVIAPLPHELHVELSLPPEPEPTTFTYESSERIDVDSRIETRPLSAPGAACGDAGTLCADLDVRHLPRVLETRIIELGRESRIEFDGDNAGSSGAEVFADVIIGKDDGGVLEAHAEALSIPDHLRLRFVEGADETLERAEFHTCNRDYKNRTCAAASEGTLGGFNFTVRNFVEADRPVGFKPPPLDRPQHLAAIADGSAAATDGVRFETVGRFTAIKEVQYVSKDVFGLRTRIGNGEAFLGQVDLRNIDVDVDDPDNELIDLTADLAVESLPGELGICFRDQGKAHVAVPTDPITAACEVTEPFGPLVDLEGSPLSVAYSADGTFSIDGHVRLREQGRAAATAPDPVTDDSNVDAVLNVSDLPADLVTHLLLPAEEGEPDGPSEAVRARFEAPSRPTSIVFSGAQTKGDAGCKDPRPGKDALCVKGTLLQFPSTVDLFMDASQAPSGPVTIDGTDNNFVLRTEGGSDTELVDFDFSSVKRDPESPVPKSDIVLVDGDLRGVPAAVVGKLRTPQDDIDNDEPEINFVAEPALDEIDLGFRNYLPPEVFDPVGPPHAQAGTTFDQEVQVQALGSLTRAAVRVTDLKRVGYRVVRNADDEPLDTKVVSLGFAGAPKTARAFADIVGVPDTAKPGLAEQLIADVVLADLPAGVDVCVRGEKTAGSGPPRPGSGTWCDTVQDEQGAFRLDAPGGSTAIDVDAFVRQQKAGGTELLAARLDITDLPPVVQAALPVGEDAALDLRGLAADGSTPHGIGEVAVEFVTNHDLEADGWNDADRPFSRRPLPTGGESPFPAPSSANQHVSAALADDDTHLRARVGDATAGGSELQRLRLLKKPCPTPRNSPPDYPRFPDDAMSGYTCVAGDFAPSAVADRLDLHVADGFAPGDILRLHDAGLDDVPSWFQFTLSETTSTTGLDEQLRRRCGPASTEPADASCMAPLIRFDQPLPDARLFGVLLKGDSGLMADAATHDPTDPAPDFDALPAPGPGSPWEADWGPDPRGIRAKLLEPVSGGPTLAKVGFLLPLPQSLTVNQPQDWSRSIIDAADNTAEAAKDLRFGYAVRNASGVPVNNLGELAVFVLDGESETLVTDIDPNLVRGVPLPGELGLDIYQRESERQGRTFMQVDGRTSTPFRAGLRTFDGEARPDDPNEDVTAIERMALALEGAPTIIPGSGPFDPSFRLRFEMLGAPEAAPGSGGGGGGGSTAVAHPQLVGTLTASLNFAPDSTPARLIEGVVLMDSPAVGVELGGFEQLDAPAPSRTPAEFSAEGSIVFDPFNIRLDDDEEETHIRIRSKIEALLSVDRAHNFRLRNNVARLNPRLIGPAGSSALVGPITWDVEQFRVEQDTGTLDIQIEITYSKCLGGLFSGFPVFGCDHTPPFPPVHASFHVCSGGGPEPSILSGLPLNGPLQEWSGTVNLFDDPRFDFNLINVPDLLGGDIEGKVLTALCDIDPGSYELIHHDDPSAQVLHPGDPLGVVGHDVPPAGSDAPPVGTTRAFADLSDAEPPDFTVSGTVDLCGLHRFGTLIVDGTLRASETAITTAPPVASAVAACPPEDVGRLVVLADEVLVNGTLSANAVATTVPFGATGPAGNGGGGHAGKGGDGSTGAGGEPFGNLAPTSPVTEPGSVGGGGAGGRGGGLLAIVANTVAVSGTVSANGTHGGTGSCAPGSETAGSGGGSGGGISIMAASVDLTGGSVSAIGGFGGSGFGGGGGGAGGIVKVHTPNFSGPIPTMTAGGAGISCHADQPDGGDGQALNASTYVVRVVHSQADGVAVGTTPITTGWAATGTGLKIGYSYSLPDDPPLSDSILAPTVMYLCAVGRDELEQTFDMPDAGSPFDAPCGTSEPHEAVVLGNREDDVAAIDSPLQLFPARPDGVYGVWTHVCTAYPASGLFPPTFSCHEPIPARPDFVFGVDTANPEVSVDPAVALPTTWFFNPHGGFFAVADNDVPVGVAVVAATLAESPIDRVLCRQGPADEDATGKADSEYWRCGTGRDTFTFDDGATTLTVRVYDVAGNVGHDVLDILVDKTDPEATAAVTASPPVGNDGWHRVTPAVTVTVRDAHSGLAGAPLAYRIDGGTERTVAKADCTLIGLVGEPRRCPIPATELAQLVVGTHRIQFSGVDLVGNRLVDDAMQSITLKIDNEAPRTALATVLAEPDGNNGWFVTRPLAVLTARDQLTGSGVAGSTLSINGVAQAYTGPRPLDDGPNHVCFSSVDVAGNPETESCEDFSVDLDDPTAIVNAPSPDGDNGWYVTNPTVTIASADTGSGIAPDFGATPAPCLLVAPPVAPSGVCISIDGGPFRPYSGPVVLPEGVHQVRAFAVDRAGRRSDIASREFLVDLSAPEAVTRTFAETAYRKGWFKSGPHVVLTAVDGDESSGVASLDYRLRPADPFTPYERPFAVPEGLSALEVRTTDEAGRVRTESVPLKVDRTHVGVTALAPCLDAIVSLSSPPPPCTPGSGPGPVVWLRSSMLAPETVRLYWRLQNLGATAEKVEVRIFVYRESGFLGAHVQHKSIVNVPAGKSVGGHTLWTGDVTAPFRPAVPGVYYFRVMTIDEAGNRSFSGESVPLLIEV